MSKLENILGGTKFTAGSGSRQVNDMGLDRSQLKAAKQEIKDLMLELLNNASNENNKTQSDLWRSMRKKVNQL